MPSCGLGPLTRYLKMRVADAPGMSGTFSPPATSKETARAVMHVGIADQLWRKTFPAFPAHAQHSILLVWQEAHCLNCYLFTLSYCSPLSFISTDLHISSSDTYMMKGYRDSNPSNGHQATCLIVTKSIMGMVDYFSHQIELRKMHLENMHAVSMLSRGHYPKWKKKQQNKGGLVSLYHSFAYPLFIHGHHVSMTDTPKTRIGFKFMQNPFQNLYWRNARKLTLF